MLKMFLPSRMLAEACLCAVIVSSSHQTVEAFVQPVPSLQAKKELTADQKAASAAFKALIPIIEKKNLRAAAPKMTERGFNNYMAGEFLTPLIIVQEGMLPKENAEKVKALLQKHGIDKVNLEELDIDFEKTLLKPFKGDRDKILAAALELTGAIKGGGAEEMMMSMNGPMNGPMNGDVVGAETKGDVVTLEIQPTLPDGPLDVSGDIEVSVPDDLRVFLQFKKSDDQWKYDGENDQKMAEMFGEMSVDGGMGYARESQPTIEDPDFPGKTVHGKTVSLKDYRGKLVLVDFWGTWCQPCVAELPSLKIIHEDLKKHGFEIIGVAADQREDLQAFLKNQPLNWPNVVDGEGALADRFGINAFPTTLLIDKDGNHIDSNLFGKELVLKIAEQLKLADKDIQATLDKIGSEDKGSYGGVGTHEDKETLGGGGNYDRGELPLPKDPGKNFSLLEHVGDPVDDLAIFGASFHRYKDLQRDAQPKEVSLESVPRSTDLPMPVAKDASSLGRVLAATVVISGGGDAFFTGGAVIVSPDGLALTNFHIAAEIEAGPLMALTNDGRTHRVKEFVCGSKAQDVALVRLEGENFSWVPIAASSPKPGDNLVSLHHSEMRFYTYDRGYVQRHVQLGKERWMEVSVDFAPGGSGCGFFNDRHELVGLASSINYGDGPLLAEILGDEDAMDSQEDYEDQEFGPSENGLILVKYAVAWSSISSLWRS